MSIEHLENASDQSVDLDQLSSVLERVKVELNIRRIIAVRLVNEAEIIDLNSRFRNLSESTDVLTFPSGLDDPLPLGDIAICVPYAIRQSEVRGVDVNNELAALLIHGILHLLGYDDETDSDRHNMQQKMNEVGEKLGILIDAEWTSVLHQADEIGQE